MTTCAKDISIKSPALTALLKYMHETMDVVYSCYGMKDNTMSHHFFIDRRNKSNRSVRARRCSIVATPLLEAARWEFPFGSALLACQAFGKLVLATGIWAEFRSWQTPLAYFAYDLLRGCLSGCSCILSCVPIQPSVWRRGLALLAHHGF